MHKNGQTNSRRLLQSWVMPNEGGQGTAVEHYRRLAKGRFGCGSDWLRLVFLGGILVTLSTVALADALTVEHHPGHFGGSSAIFGGAAVALIVTKIARGALHWDWLLSAVLYSLAGLVLSEDGNFTRALSLFCVCSLMLACGAIRIWTGLTASPEEGASWILCSGWVDIFAGLSIAFVWFVATPTTIALILAFDTLFQGIAIVGFGISLKQRHYGSV